MFQRTITTTFQLLWENIQPISSVVAIVVTIILAGIASCQNIRAMELQERMLKNQITIEQVNIRHSDLNNRYYSMIEEIEEDPFNNIATVVAGYVDHILDPTKPTSEHVTRFRNILYDNDQLSYDLLSGHYSIEIALPIMTGFYARIEAAINTVSKEKQIEIRKGIRHYTYLQIKHAVPYLDRKSKELDLRTKELEAIEWSFGLPPP